MLNKTVSGLAQTQRELVTYERGYADGVRGVSREGLNLSMFYQEGQRNAAIDRSIR